LPNGLINASNKEIPAFHDIIEGIFRRNGVISLKKGPFFVKIWSNGQVMIPSYIRKKLNIQTGERVVVQTDGKTIDLIVDDNNAFENETTLSSKGTITIPSEIRNICEIDVGEKLKIEWNEQGQKVTFVPPDDMRDSNKLSS
jgi:AbrB family looped-hinge helix DNA binding protein